MTYPEIRQHVQNHFRDRLAKFKVHVAELGPISNDRVEGFGAIIRAAEADLSTFVNATYLDDEGRLLSEFCEAEGITDQLTSDDRRLILRDYQQAYLQLAKAALKYNALYSEFELEGDAALTSPIPSTKAQSQTKVAQSRMIIRARPLWPMKQPL